MIVDTGGLISEVDRGSRHHAATRSLLDERRSAGERLAVSPFVLSEVDYLVSVRLGRPDQALRKLEDVADGAYSLEPFRAKDVARAIEVMRQYADLEELLERLNAAHADDPDEEG